MAKKRVCLEFRGVLTRCSVEAAPGEYMVILDKSAGARLGIDVDHKEGLSCLFQMCLQNVTTQVDMLEE